MILVASSYSLGDHYEGFVKTLVESGRYASASEVMRDSLRMLEEREKLRAVRLAALQAHLDEGFASGPSEPGAVTLARATGINT